MYRGMKLLFLLLPLMLEANFLEPHEAFKPSINVEKNLINVEIGLGKGIYLYEDKVKLEVLTPQGLKLDYALPAAVAHESFEGEDPEMIFSTDLRFHATILGLETAQEVTLRLSYQGCSEQGLCYQPMTFEQSTTVESGGAMLNEEDEIKALFEKNLLVVLLAFFGFGLLLSLTPCVFPMIPILSSIIVSQGSSITTKRAFFLSLVYVLSMAAAYTLAGVMAGLFGSNIQAALQTPWVIILFSMIFVALALSMFGFYHIQVPHWVQNSVTKVSKDAEGKGVLSVAIMGFLSALIVGPCVAAPLAGALAYIGDTGNAALGGSALFMMSMGMGVPLLLVGVGAGKFMPKPGGWMKSVEAIFGVILLGVAIWMLDRIVPPETTMLLFALLLIFSSIYLRIFDPLTPESNGWMRLLKGVSIVMFLYGVMLFVGAMSQGSFTQPLKAFAATHTTLAQETTQGVNFSKKVTTIEALDTLLATATQTVMLDFTASWCVQCKELEEGAFKDPRVVAATLDFLRIKVDISEENAQSQALKKRYGVFGPPAMRFVKDNQEIKASRVQGVVKADKLLTLLPR